MSMSQAIAAFMRARFKGRSRSEAAFEKSCSMKDKRSFRNSAGSWSPMTLVASEAAGTKVAVSNQSLIREARPTCPSG